jgi:tetratricopeptide (TPR) repeat protein
MARFERRSALSSRQIWLSGLLLIVATVIAYLPAWNGQPIWDDNAHITAPWLRSGHGLVEIWSQLGATQQYYPLVHSVFWIEQKIWGDSVLGYHLVNILLHGFSAVVLLKILLRLKIPGAWLAAGLFALHPVQVESVAWISELKNTLSGFLFFWSILSYFNFDQRRNRGSYIASLVLFLLGLMCKTVIAPLPAIILVVLWFKRGRLKPREDVVPLLPFFAVGIGAGLITAWVEHTLVGARGAVFQLSILQRCLIAARDFWFYLFKLIWPAKLAFIYPRWGISAPAWWQFLFLIALIVLVMFVWILRQKFRGPLAALLIFLGLLFPALGFINVYPFLYSFVADHFQYLACIGPLTLFASGVTSAIDSFAPGKPFLRSIVYGGLLLILAGSTWRQCHEYRDIETLWRTTIARNPNCWMAYSNLGSFLSERGNTTEAISDFRKALELWPDQSKDHNNLGKALAQEGRTNEAMNEFRTALKISPDNADAESNIGALLLQQGDTNNAISHLRQAVEKFPREAQAHINLGNALLEKGETDSAVAEYEKTLDLPFDHAESHYSIANALRKKGDVERAITHYRNALEIRPDYANAHNNLGNALRQQGHIAEAEQEYDAALKSEPGLVLAQNNLAWLLATAADPRLRNGAKAVQLGEQAALATDGNDPVILHTLAAAYAENGEFEKAVAAAKDALAIADAKGIISLAESLRSKIVLYQNGTAYHDSAPTP